MPNLRVPVRWLEEFVDFSGSPKELADLLSGYGLEATPSIVGEFLKGVRVARLPSGRLGLADPQARLLSFAALGMGSSSRPVELSGDYPLGSQILDWVDDSLLEVEIPANRGDLMSVLGLARELSAYLDQRLKLPRFHLKHRVPRLEAELKLEIEAPEALDRYQAVLADVAIGDSKFELAWRVYICGGRVLNYIVDLTNYLMYKYGQPLHAFDYDRLRGKQIVVRWARSGEHLETLDGVERMLNPDDLVIADAQSPVALAGVMGGIETQVSDLTKRTVLECACFKPWAVRRTRQHHNLLTEAAQRFATGVDPKGLQALDEFHSEIGSGVKGGCDYSPVIHPRVIRLKPARVNRCLGIKLSHQEISNFLNRLGFDVEADELLRVTVPSFRLDVKDEADLVEEVARVYGYHRLPSRFQVRSSEVGVRHPVSQAMERLRSILVGQGFYEVQTLSFVDEARLGRLNSSEPLRPQNPISERLGALRPTLLPGLLGVVEANLRHNNPDLRIFEIGKVFLARPSREGLKLGGVMTGSAWPDDWAERPRIIDFFDLKGVVEQLFDSLGLENLKFLAPGPDFLFPGVQIYLGDEDLGWLGKVRKEILASFEILGPVYGFEFGLDRLLAALRPTLVYRPIPKFPAVVRDLSFLLDDKVEAGQVAGLIRSLAGPMLERLQFFDCFRGEQLGPEKKSLGLRLTFRANDRTLNRAEVDSLIQQISDGLKDRLGARLRGPQG